MLGRNHLLAGIAGVSLLVGTTLLATPGTAAATAQRGQGVETEAQPYHGNPDATDWLGSYVWQGKQAWCVRFGHRAPNGDEPYQPGEELLDKWGQPLPPDTAADISYLLLRYGNTADNDHAAALAHLLHSWTAAPRNADDLNPDNDFAHIGYDVDFHFSRLPDATKAAVAELRQEAAANRGPWHVAMTAPDHDQIINALGTWTLTVHNAAGNGIGKVPVTLTATDATVTESQLTTPADGSPLSFTVTPTGPRPAVVASLQSPAAQPYVQIPGDDNTQQIITTGGEVPLTAQAEVTAITAPGAVTVVKVDATSGATLSGVSLRLTGADHTSPVTKQDGTPLAGPDGKPIALTTGQDGTATVPDLATPQDVCVVEVAPASGYEDAFDPSQPPLSCGTVTPGATLALSLSNSPNVTTVPIAIPAGGGPGGVATAATHTVPRPATLAGLGGLVLVGGSLVALVRRRRLATRRR